MWPCPRELRHCHDYEGAGGVFTLPGARRASSSGVRVGEMSERVSSVVRTVLGLAAPSTSKAHRLERTRQRLAGALFGLGLWVPQLSLWRQGWLKSIACRLSPPDSLSLLQALCCFSSWGS